jgi:hypothetical protein
LPMHLQKPYHRPKSNTSRESWDSRPFEGECWNVRSPRDIRTYRANGREPRGSWIVATGESVSGTLASSWCASCVLVAIWAWLTFHLDNWLLL